MDTLASQALVASSDKSRSASASASASATSETASVVEATVPIHFTTIDNFFQELSIADTDNCVFENVSPQDFDRIKNERQRRGNKFRFRLYEAKPQLLFITIPTAKHERAHAHLYTNYVYDSINRMGLKNSWIHMHGTTYGSEYEGGNGDSGEGDSAGGPEPYRLDDNDWPTIAIESGVSNTLGVLRRKMRWWFTASNHQVKIVLLIDLNRDEERIIIEKYTESPLRDGGPTTRNYATRLVPQMRQAIIIEQIPQSPNRDLNPGDPESYRVIRDALRLEFELLFLRSPSAREGDIVIDHPELREFAARLWRRRTYSSLMR